MKFSECIQFTLSFCNVNFSISGFDLIPEVDCFSETGSWKHRDRKSKSISSESSWVFVMRVLSSFFDFSILVAARIIFFHILLHREQKISKVSSASPDQNIKKVGYDLHYRIVFSFHQAYFRLPVSMIGTSGFRKKQPISGLRLKTEVENMTLHQFRVNSINP